MAGLRPGRNVSLLRRPRTVSARWRPHLTDVIGFTTRSALLSFLKPSAQRLNLFPEKLFARRNILVQHLCIIIDVNGLRFFATEFGILQGEVGHFLSVCRGAGSPMLLVTTEAGVITLLHDRVRGR